MIQCIIPTSQLGTLSLCVCIKCALVNVNDLACDLDDIDTDDFPSPVDACLNARVNTPAGRRHATVRRQHRCVRG